MDQELSFVTLTPCMALHRDDSHPFVFCLCLSVCICIGMDMPQCAYGDQRTVARINILLPIVSFSDETQALRLGGRHLCLWAISPAHMKSSFSFLSHLKL